MTPQETEIAILKFDVACALAVLGESEWFPFELPSVLGLPGEAQVQLDACVDQDTFTRFGCKISSAGPASPNYQLSVGQDKLRLQPSGRIIAGGSGVTVQLQDEKLLRSYALKVPRMSVLAYDKPTLRLGGQLEERFRNEYRAFENERQLARRLSHENIAQHLFGYYKRVRREGGDVYYPYSVSEWIDGARSLSDFLVEEGLSSIKIVGLINQSFSALKYIHDRKIIHWDLKADNVLVSSSGTVKIIDFGNAKFTENLKDPEDLLITTTQGKYPTAAGFTPEENDAQGSRRFQIHLPDISWNHPYLDLWMMGQEWNRCLELSSKFLDDPDDSLADHRQRRKAETRESDSDPHSVLECLEVIFDRLLHTLMAPYVHQMRATGTHFDPEMAYYQNADQVLEELSRIEPLLGAGQKTPELLVSLGEIVRLPVTGNSVFTRRVARVTGSCIAKPTKLHLQLAQVREIYPGATHTRFEHLLGTLTTSAHFLRSLYLNEMNAFWRVTASELDIRAVLLAAILHDVGHIAYGHFIEEMVDLMTGAGHVDYIRTVLAECERYTLFLENDASADYTPEPHTFAIETHEIVELCSTLQSCWCDAEGRSPGSASELRHLIYRVSAILGPRLPPAIVAPLSRPGTRQALDQIMKSIVDGPLDADKLDYLRRDSHHSGVAYANGIDLERFFESLRICMPTSEDGTPLPSAIGIAEKGVAAVETIITARYHLFYIVYWHRTVRGITAILQRVLQEIFLQLDDEPWFEFRRALLTQFRQRDDREALHWLEDELAKLELSRRKIGNEILLSDEAQAGEPVQIADLMAALRGERAKYFEMAFELNYSGFVATEAWRGQTASGRLHDEISQRFHSKKARSGDRREGRQRQTELRKALEQRFSNEVRNLIPDKRLGAQGFRIDTILLDVPESDKDQMSGLYVDRRTKRTRQNPDIKLSGIRRMSDFEDIRNVSPIAAGLSDVFRRWARRVRIFMTRRDLERLEGLGLRAGDVASLWEKVLYAHFRISPDAQLSMPGM